MASAGAGTGSTWPASPRATATSRTTTGRRAYHYRDFVIQALNEDMPYDQFVRWQIAGDEFEPDNNLALMATGFLGAGTHATQITANQVEKERYDELDDMAATVGTAMLGLTIGCARCHDHKFDPDPAGRLLPPAVDVHHDGAQRGRARLAARKCIARRRQAFDARARAAGRGAGERSSASELPGRFDAWLASDVKRVTPDLAAARPGERRSPRRGATFDKQDDGSLLVERQERRRTTSTRSTVPTKLREHHGRAARSAGRRFAAQEGARPGRERQLCPLRLPALGRAAGGRRSRRAGEAGQSQGDLRAGRAADRRHDRRQQDERLGRRWPDRQEPGRQLRAGNAAQERRRGRR